ncbi:hypothetical protein D3C86_1772520 [compost metagenome]
MVTFAPFNGIIPTGGDHWYVSAPDTETRVGVPLHNVIESGMDGFGTPLTTCTTTLSITVQPIEEVLIM